MNLNQTPTISPDQTQRPVVITCPRGKTGSRVLQHLSEAGIPVRPVGRSEEVAFNWFDESTWTSALHGASAAFLVYQPDLAFPEAVGHITRISQLAKDAGLDHLVLLSGRGEEGALAAEQALAAGGVPWTVVRSAFFMQNFSEGLYQPGVMAGQVSLPTDDIIEPFIDADDVAAVAVAALTDDRHQGRTYEVSGPTAVTFAEATAEIASATGRSDLKLVQVSPEEFVADLEALGLPKADAWGICELFQTVLDGRNSTPTHGVEEALGRPARSFAAYADQAARDGMWKDQS